MDPIVFTEARKIWTAIAKDTAIQEHKVELDMHRQLLNFFQVGDYYYYVFNIKTSSIEFMSTEMKAVLGYETELMNTSFFLSRMHPDDQPWFIAFEQEVGKFFATLANQQIPNYKVRYDYRMQKNDGSYIRILQQVVTIQFDENGGLLRTFGVHTDITHIKPTGTPLLSFIGMNGEPSYINVEVEKVLLPGKDPFTQRERQVLVKLIEGYSSRQIAKQLSISHYTVLTYRKKMLAKTGCANTAALLGYVITNGLI